MKKEHEPSKIQHESYGQPTRDRLDWISKYLELADRVMEDRPSEKPGNSGKR